MQTSNINLTEKSQVKDDDDDDGKQNQGQQSSQDMNQLACCLKSAIFSTYISNYLMDKAEEMWNLYEKRIDKFLKEKQLDITCHHTRPQIAMHLKELVKQQQGEIASCKRAIEILCSSRKRLRNEDKYSVQLQSTHRSATSAISMRVPKTPRCIDRYANNTLN